MVRLWEVQWNKIIPGRGKWRLQSQIGHPGRASLKWRLNKGEWAMWSSGGWAFPAHRIASEEPWTWQWTWPALEKARRPVCSQHHRQGEEEETGQRGATECSPEKEHHMTCVWRNSSVWYVQNRGQGWMPREQFGGLWSHPNERLWWLGPGLLSPLNWERLEGWDKLSRML